MWGQRCRQPGVVAAPPLGGSAYACERSPYAEHGPAPQREDGAGGGTCFLLVPEKL